MKWVYILYWVIIIKDHHGNREKVTMQHEYPTHQVADYWEYKVTHEGNNKAIKTWVDSAQTPKK